MRWIKVALASCVSLLAMASHAQADFIITPIAFALFAGPLGASLSFAAIYTGLQIAAYAAVIGSQLAMAAQARQKIDPGELKNTFQEAETPEFNAVGRVKVGGLKAFGNTKGSIISRLIWHVKGPMVGIEAYYLGGREVTVDDDTGAVSTPPWAKWTSSWAFIKSKVGDGTETAWSELIADYPSLWTADHRCRGIFQSLVRFEVPDLSTEEGNKRFQKLYQGGAPDLEVVARIAKIYDPRQSGQDADDENTWAWTDNGILCAAHIMRHYPDLKSTDFDWAFLADEADRADAIVPTKTGTEPRARCWGIWPSESSRGDVMQQVLDSIGAEIVLSDAGLIRIRLIDDEPTSEITFGDDHVTEFDWKSGPEAVERPNVCRIKYYSPERGYDMGEIDLSGIAWARVATEIDRYGEKVFDVELPFCPSASQAQRIARRMFLLARADAGAMRTNMVGMAAWGVSYATVADGDDDMLCRISPPRIDDESGQVDIPYVVWPAALIDQPWNPATMEADPPIEAPEIQYEAVLETPAAPYEWAQVIYPDNSREIRIRFTDVPGGTLAEATRRSYPGGNPSPWSGMTEVDQSTRWFAHSVADYEGLDADFRVRFFNDDDDGSYWSPTLEVRPVVVDNTPPSAPVFTFPTSTSVNITVGDELNVASAKIERLGTTTWVDLWEGNVRPGDVSPTVSIEPEWSLRAHVYTSDGTPSPTATHTP